MIIAFDHLLELYKDDEDFGKIWRDCTDHLHMEDFHIIEGFLFRGDQLCIPTSLREALIKEAQAGGLAGHFGQDKTFHLINPRFYWPQARRDTNNFEKRCVVRQTPKS